MTRAEAIAWDHAQAEHDRAVREKALEDLLKLIAIEHRWANWNICRCRKVADSPDRDRDLWQWWLVHIRALASAAEAQGTNDAS